MIFFFSHPEDLLVEVFGIDQPVKIVHIFVLLRINTIKKLARFLQLFFEEYLFN
jgi:hypothetical protein